MFDSAMLDVAIGLAFTFLLFSLLITALSEMLASVLRWRAMFLWEGLANLLRSEGARNKLYEHPLVRGLTRTVGVAQIVPKRKGPSYIPSKTFALALVDILREPYRAADAVAARLRADLDALKGDPPGAVRRIAATLDEYLAAPLPPGVQAAVAGLKARVMSPVDPAAVAGFQNRVREVIQRIPAADRPAIAAPVTAWLDRPVAADTAWADFRADFSQVVDNVPYAGVAADDTRHALRVLLRTLEHGDPARALEAVRAFTDARAADWIKGVTETLGSDTLERVLVPLLDEAAGDVDRFRENIEVWFNSGMDRVSGWYKRFTSGIQFALALLLAAAVNIDVLAITRTLWREPSLREAIVNQAGAAVQQPPPSLREAPVDQPGEGPDPIVVRLGAPFVNAAATLPIDVMLPASTAAGDSVTAVVESGNITLLGADGEETDAVRLAATGGAETLRLMVRGRDPQADSLERVTITVGASAAPAAAKVAHASFVARPSADRQFQIVRGQIAGLGLPIGWRLCDLGEDLTALKRPFWCEYDWSIDAGGPQRKPYADAGVIERTGKVAGFMLLPLVRLEGWAMIFGWLLAAVAGALGAPFWFDTLKRFMSIRSSGKAPEERPHAPKEVSQPPEPGQRPKDADALAAIRGR